LAEIQRLSALVSRIDHSAYAEAHKLK
jgi:hypothetical protein